MSNVNVVRQTLQRKNWLDDAVSDLGDKTQTQIMDDSFVSEALSE
jgi:hypothetical protein